MKINFTKLNKLSGTVALIALKGPDLGDYSKQVDAKVLKNAKFEGKKNEFLDLIAPAKLDCDRAIIAGAGNKKEFDKLAQQELGAKLYEYANKLKISELKIACPCPDLGAELAFGAKLKSYQFLKYYTKTQVEKRAKLVTLTIMVDDTKAAKKAWKDNAYEEQIEAIYTTRDLVTEPSNHLTPEIYAKFCEGLKKQGLKVEVLGEKEMTKLGMHALLGVGQGSEHESKLVVMRHNGGKKGDAPVAFVGKGVTFDTGGISIKPANGMWDMKYDMGGSATVVGLMQLLVLRKAKVNAVGVVGLVENMPDGKAQNPGDVVKSMSGQTIEVLNTDAEGRLVLADALWYTQSKYKPQFMVNLATLTGAIVVALGTSRAGLFSNNKKLANRLYECGKATGDEVWELPLGDVYDKQINSEIADMQNIGADREAGSITAAQFLQRFVNEVPWAHLDIAGVAWDGKGNGTGPKGATGYGVRLLNELVREHYEG